MYEISANTVTVLSNALHELASTDLQGVDAIRELARIIGSKAGESPVAPISTEAVHEPVTLNKPKPYVVFVLGGPGSGKGTVCPRLVADYGFSHLSVGELLRAEVASGSTLGHEVESIMKSGGLVSDDLALKIANDAITRISESGNNKILLDGYPRTLEQATAFEQAVCPASCILWLTCAEDVLVQRILERGKSSGRQDDTAESVIIRLKNFNENTERIRKHYQDQPDNKLTLIDASLPVDDVYTQIKQLFD